MREEFFSFPWVLPSSLNILASEDRSTDHILHVIFAEKEPGAYKNIGESFQYLAYGKKIFGDIEESKLYPIDGDGTAFSVMISKEKIEKEWCYESEDIGKGHLSFSFGSKLGSLIDGSKALSTNSQISVLVYGNDGEDPFQKDLIANQFVAGMVQGSTSNKLQPKVPQKSIYLKLNQQIIDAGHHIAYGQTLARSLVNLPPNQLRPDTYENYAREVVKLLNEECKNEGQIELEVFDEDQLRKDGAGLLIAVGQASDSRPRLLRLQWSPKEASEKSVALVGKGITFDSGGLNLKPGGSMRLMKKDMGGSAAVFGAFVSACLHRVQKTLTAWIPLAENMVAGNSFRPGDVHTSLSGRNVEIDNTDAEGRLILADAISYAVQEKPSLLIDVATLTGAARVALGPQVDPVFGNTKHWIEQACRIGQEIGDLVWHLPRFKFYKKYLESNVADTVNSSNSGFAGAITAALFLDDFVENTPWLHIDSYMWTDKPNHLTTESGACPRTVRLLVRLIEEV